MSPKQKTGPKRESAPEQTQKIQSEIATFEQRWDVKLTAPQTNQIMERVTEQITEQGSEVKIRPAVRNQMFAMLIEKAPEKAMAFRMKMKERQGARYTAEQKQRVLNVAREQGWRAARMELSTLVKAKKPKKKEEISGAGVAKRKKSVGVKTPEKKVLEKTDAKVASGASIQEVLAKAEAVNRNISAIWDEHNEKLAKIEKKYEKKLLESGTYGSVKDKTERMQQVLDRNPEYKKEVGELENKTLAKLNTQKEKRDTLLKTALGGMGVKGPELAKMHKNMKDAREQMGTYRAIKNENFVREDLSSGVIENQQFVATGLQQLRVRAKRMGYA